MGKIGIKWVFAGLLLAGLLGSALFFGNRYWQQLQIRDAVVEAIPAVPDMEGRSPALAARVERLQERVGDRGETVDALGDLAQLYHANGFLREANRCYALLRQLDPGDARWAHLSALIISGFGQLERSIDLWEGVLDQVPDYVPARLRMADSLLKLNDFQSARNHYETVLEGEPENAHALLGLARIEFEESNWEGALAYLERVVRLTDYQLGYDLIVSVYERLGRVEEANEVRRQIKASGAYRDPRDPWLDALVDLSYDPFRIALAAGFESSFERAEQLLRRAIRMDPEDVSYRLQLSMLYLDHGRQERALMELKRMTESNPEFADGWAHLSRVQQQMGDTRNSQRTLLDGLMHCPDSPGLRLMWGSHLRREGRMDEAVRELRHSIHLRPNEAAAYLELSQALIAMGRVEEGLAQLRRALEVEPGNPNAIAILAFQSISIRDRAEADQWLSAVHRQPRVGQQLTQYLLDAYRDAFGAQWRARP